MVYEIDLSWKSTPCWTVLFRWLLARSLQDANAPGHDATRIRGKQSFIENRSVHFKIACMVLLSITCL